MRKKELPHFGKLIGGSAASVLSVLATSIPWERRVAVIIAAWQLSDEKTALLQITTSTTFL